MNSRTLTDFNPSPDNDAPDRSAPAIAAESVDASGPGAARDAAFATTLAKGLQVLEAFTLEAPLLGNSEIAARTGIARPTVARLAHTLARLGYLKYDPTRAKYGLWTRLLETAYPLIAGLEVRQVARPGMQELAASVRGAVSLTILDGTRVVIIECSRAADLAGFTPEIGNSSPLVQVAVGRALFSSLSPTEQTEMASRIASETPDLWEQFGERTLESAKFCEDHGFCISRGDLRTHMHSAGVPLYRSADNVCFGISCGIPAFRLRQDQLENEIGPRLVALAANVRALMDGASTTSDDSLRKTRS